MSSSERDGRRVADRERPDASLPRILVWLLAVVAVAQAVYYYPKMPEVMATHFGTGGEANGWSGRTEFVIWYGLAEALFLFLGFGIPTLIRRMPAGFVNIPHREVWLAPPHRERSIADLSVWMLWFSAATLGFLVVTAQFIYTSNLDGGGPSLSGAYITVLAAFVAVILWLVYLVYRRFGTLPSR
ncbi:MAG: DUF1648 domain-containing protein [Candidatus Eisenbacteria bacterium]|nr:DUF1648 domain-containing protein [Candidatus Eisenbacteria bacterium]